MGDRRAKQDENNAGDPADYLLPVVYDELKKIAAAKMAAERPDHTLQPTALVHEVYCRLQKQNKEQRWHGADHFLAAAVEAMRRILVDHARQKLSIKRGGKFNRLALQSVPVELPMEPDDLLAVHEALDRLAEEDLLAAELVKLRIFGGFGHASAAEHLRITKKKADYVWAYAKARLYSLMNA